MWPWTATYPIHSLQSVAAPFSPENKKQAPIYDYVIVGGGTAGCVLASRLSEDPNVSVLLVERGAVVNTWQSRVPLLSLNYGVPGGPKYRWATEPITSLAGRTFDLITGKAMGGTSKINAFLYTRSVPGEYNAWARAGRKGWSYDERFDWTIKACTALGIPYVTEANDPNQPVTACTRMDMTIDSDKRRHSTFDAFLPAQLVHKRKKNLKICSNTVAVSLDIQSTAGELRAIGVTLAYDSPNSSERYYVRTRQEIVLCSGAIASPQILLLRRGGAGPQDHLQKMGIPVVKNLPGVGSNLQDHYGVSVMYSAPLDDTMHKVLKPLTGLWELLKYITLGKGLLLAPNPQIEIFARSELLDEDFKSVVTDPSQVDARDPANIPDIEVQPIPFQTTEHDIEFRPNEGVFALLILLLRPKSTGKVRLSSTDPLSRPACTLGYLDKREDYVVLRKAVGLALRLGRQIREQQYPLRDLYVPQSGSEADLDEFIRAAGRTSYHYTSTCRMAPEEDSMPGVVDDKLRVHGVQGLRVADASIFPSVPATHTQAPTVMVAEKCADFLVKSARKKD